MSKKFKSSGNSWGNDNLDFNFDNISADFGDIRDDRTPVTKVKDQVKSSAKEYAKDPSNIAKLMRSAMPDAYGEAFDILREGNTEVRNLYNSVKDTTGPMVDRTKGLVRAALPNARGVLPKSLYERLEKATKAEESYKYQETSREDADTARVESLLTDIFKAGQDMDRQREEREDYKAQLAEGVEQTRHNDVLALLDDVRKNVSAMTQYQNRVTNPYQKKSLELSYRQYWATLDLLKTQKESNKSMLEFLAAIQKNSGLPDYAKLRNVEAVFEQGRNKFITDVRDSMFGDASGYIRQMGANASKQAKGFLENVRAGFDMTASIGEGVVSQMNSASQYGGSAGEELAAFATPMMLDELGTRLGGNLRRRLTKNKSVDRFGQRVTRGFSEIPEHLENLFTSAKYNAGVLEPLRMIGASLLPNSKPDTQMEFTAMKDLNRPAQMTAMDHKVAREVVPGLLARIHREIRVWRTGDLNTPLIGYDFERNRFSNDREIGRGLRQRFGNSESTQRSINEMINRLDPSASLNDNQRADLRTQLIGKVYDKKSLVFERLATSGQWSGDNADKFASLFKSYGHIGADGKMGVNRGTNKRQQWFKKTLQQSVAANGDPRVFVQEMINLGQYDMLLRSGMMDETGRINLEAVKTYLAGGDIRGIGDLDERYTTGSSSVGGGAAPMGSPQPNIDFAALEKAMKSSAGASQRSARNINFNQDAVTRPLSSIGATLERIEEILLNTDHITSMTYQFTTGDTEGGKSYTSLFEHIKDKTGDALGAAAASVRRMGGRAMDAGAEGIRAASILGRRAGRWGGRKARGLKNRLMGWLENDIFVGDEAKARLRAAVFKAGGYYDSATNKVITNLKDLKGDILDSAGNVVMRAEELADAYEAGKWGRKLSEIIGSGVDKITDTAFFLKDFVPSTIRQMNNSIRGAAKFAMGKLPPYDVYVKGDDKPILYANLFRLGRYMDKATNKVLYHPREISGEVVDKDGNILVNEDQLKTGLVDVRGGRIGNPASRIYARTAGKVINAFKFVTDVGANAFKWISGKLKDGASFIKNIITGRIEIGVYSKRTSEVLEEIRDFMYKRWGTKKILGDIDGDGIRENSLADMARKREKKEQQAQAASGDKTTNNTSIFASVGGMIERLKERFGKKKDEEEDEGDEDGFGLDDAADIADIADAAGEANERRKNGKSRGRSRSRRGLRRLRRMRKGKLPKPGGFGAGASKEASQGWFRRQAGKLAVKGGFNTFMPKLLARLGIGGVGVAAGAAGGAVAGGSMLASGLSGLGTVLGILTSWPVTIAAGVGALAIYGYGRAKETKVTPLSTVRLAQYGIQADDTPMVKKVFGLEQMLQEHVSYDSEGWASVDRNKAEQKALAELFELRTASHAARFLRWYDDRFYPVYTNALSRMKQIKIDSPDLSKVETQVPSSGKEAYMDALVTACEDAHNKLVGPPPNIKLTITHDEVLAVANQQRISIKKAERNETGSTAATVAADAVVGGVKTTITDTAQRIVDDYTNYEVRDRDGKLIHDLSIDSVRKALQDGGSYRVKAQVPDQVLLKDPSRLDAITTIRYKTYGLNTMVLDKVQALSSLEAFCAPYVIVNGNYANLNISVNEVLQKAGVFFGKQNTTGEASREWKRWFSERFLPVYLPFLAAIQNLTNKKDPFKAVASLTPAQQLKVANMLTGQVGIGVQMVTKSVWEATSSPWVDYVLNTNPDSVAGNMETIRVLVAKIELKEPLESTNKPGDLNEVDLNKPAFIYNTKQSRQKARGAGGGNLSTMRAAGDVLKASGDTMQRMGEAARISGGSGKTWNDLPHSNGSGWAANRDLIIAAALAVGVAPQDLAAYIAVESGFDPAARPAGGRALGLGQFMPGTWADMLKNHGARLGVPAGTPRTDARANALFTAQYLKDNLATLKKSLGRDPSVVEGYLAHFTGPTGAKELLSAGGDAIAANIRREAAAGNPNIFYDQATKRAFTVKEMLANLENKLSKKPGEFGVRNDDFNGAVSSTANQKTQQAANYTGPATPSGAQVNYGSPERNSPAGYGNTHAAMVFNNRPRDETSLRPSVNVDTSVKASTTATKMPIKPGQALELVLQREPSSEDGTFGVLRLPDGSSFLTLELPWDNNNQATSSIPPGSYQCAKRNTTRHGFSYEVKNVPGRSGILIHAGATAGDTRLGKKADSQGCILLGLGRNTRKNGQKGITDTKAAMQAFHEKMQDLPFKLTIINGQGDESSVEKNQSTARSVQQMSSAAARPTPESVAASSPAPSAPVINTQAAPAGGSRNPASSAGSAQPSAMVDASRGYRPSNDEMRARNTSLAEVFTAVSKETATILEQNLEANRRTAAATEQLVAILGKGVGQTTNAPGQTAPRTSRQPTQAPTPALSMSKS